MMKNNFGRKFGSKMNLRNINNKTISGLVVWAGLSGSLGAVLYLFSSCILGAFINMNTVF
jgi:hypothetical protein